MTGLKIATWNLARAQPQTPQGQAQQHWIHQVNADLWIFTETHPDFSLGEDYRSVMSQPDPSGTEGEGAWVQIWVRDEGLQQISALPTADPERTVCALIELDHGGRGLVYGTVLPWGSPWRNYPAKDGAAFLAALAVQQADWQQLQQAYPNTLLMVAGDFNQDLNVLPYYGSRRTKQALRQALLEADLECLTFGDNDPVRRLINGQHSNLDHICMPPDPQLQIQRTFAWPEGLEELRGLSEHFGVGLEIICSRLSG
ncbi:MAG: endonuclease/exonuclease/phosphatase family protein [Spirulina sp.]